MTNHNFQQIVDEAHAAGMAALNACVPTPMIVGQAAGLFGNKIVPGTEEYVEGGVCGFAWIKFKGNTAFGRWAKKTGLARDDYPSGLYISAREGGQSMQRKEAYADAYAKHLKDNGIDAWMSSRMD
jgi:hypothetical protein